MKSTRLLTLIFLSLTFIKAFATLEEAKEALAKKNQEEKVKEDELLKAEIELVRLKSINYSLVKDKESIRQQQIALGSNEEEFKKRKEGKQTEFAERAEKCINLESQFLFTKKFQPILASSFISSPEILLLVKKRKQDFVDESEIDAVKSYLNAFQEIEKKYKDAYALVRSSKFHNEIYQSDKEKLGKDLIKLKDDLEKEINERKKQEIMDKIKELEVQIVSITQKITEIENKLPGLEKDLVAKEEEYNKMFNLFHWHKLMEEMTTIIEGRSYKEMNNIIVEIGQTQDSLFQLGENYANTKTNLDEITEKIKFYKIALTRKIDHSDAESNLNTLIPEKNILQNEEKAKSRLVDEVLAKLEEERAKIANILSVGTNYIAKEQDFNEINLDSITKSFKSVFIGLIDLYLISSSFSSEKYFKNIASKDVELFGRLQDLSASFKMKLEKTKSDADSSLVSSNKSIETKELEKQGIENEIEQIKKEISKVTEEVRELEKKQEESTRRTIIVVSVVLVIVAAVGGIFLYRRKIRRTNRSIDGGTEELI